jgi:hypothetical protein
MQFYISGIYKKIEISYFLEREAQPIPTYDWCSITGAVLCR